MMPRYMNSVIYSYYVSVLDDHNISPKFSTKEGTEQQQRTKTVQSIAKMSSKCPYWELLLCYPQTRRLTVTAYVDEKETC